MEVSRAHDPSASRNSNLIQAATQFIREPSGDFKNFWHLLPSLCVVFVAIIVTTIYISSVLHPPHRAPEHLLSETSSAEVKSYATTYRLKGVPDDRDEQGVESLVKEVLDLKSDIEIRIHSLARDPYSGNKKIATLTFSKTPTYLSEKKEEEDKKEGKEKKKKREWHIPKYQKEHKGRIEFTVSFDIHFHGFTPLENDTDCTVDLIAISGLGGHAFGSFKEKDGSYMWLRDSLPQDLKRTRILLYGYDSTLANSASVQTIADLANDLQKAIGFIRNYDEESDEADPERPLVLLGHSLGGIIAKQALITMKDGFKSDQANLKATHAILFFGVPNHGMEIASLIAMVGDGPNRYLLETLSRTSETLRKQEKDFPEVFYFKDSIIFSYYETKESPIVELINGKWKRSDTKRALLVDRNSATQARPWESKERYIQPIARDHSEMVKFPPNDDDYKKVLRHLKEITKNASAVIQDRFESSSTALMESVAEALYERANGERKQVIKSIKIYAAKHLKESPTSIGWFRKSWEFQQWLSGSSKFVLCYLDAESTGKTSLLSRLLEEKWRFHRSLVDEAIFIDLSRYTSEHHNLRLNVLHSILYQAIAMDFDRIHHFSASLNSKQVQMRIKSFFIRSHDSPVNKYSKYKFSNAAIVERLAGFVIKRIRKAFIETASNSDNVTFAQALNLPIVLESAIVNLRKKDIPTRELKEQDFSEAIGVLFVITLRMLIWNTFSNSSSRNPIYLFIDGFDRLSERDRGFLLELFCYQEESEAHVLRLICSRPEADVCELVKNELIINKASETKGCINSLLFQGWQSRRFTGDKVNPWTNDWIWDHPAFISWNNEKQILWINGKPGSGKSTIARMITDRLTKREPTTAKPIVASFFYSARLGEKATGHEYMLQSILYQILKEASSLYPHYQDTYRHLFDNDSDEITWQLSDLEKVFETVALDQQEDRDKLYCILDGMDEADHSNNILMKRSRDEDDAIRRLLSWLSELVDKSRHDPWLKLIVVSRPTKEITFYLGNVKTITVDEHNSVTIKRVVAEKIEDLKEVMRHWATISGSPFSEDQAEEDLREVKRIILDSAKGVILWVVLVMNLLDEVVKGGHYSPNSLTDAIKDLDPDLDQLYPVLIKRLEDKNKKRKSWLPMARSMLTWTCFAGRPLSLAEFQDAITLRSGSAFNPRNRISLYQGTNWEPVKRALTDDCGCLVEVVPSDFEISRHKLRRQIHVDGNHLVQIFHQTVKEFLEEEVDAAKPLDLSENDAHKYISTSLMTYLSASIPIPALRTKKLDGWTTSDFNALARHLQDRPLLPYAMEFLTYHKPNRDALERVIHADGLSEQSNPHEWYILQPLHQQVISAPPSDIQSSNPPYFSFILRLFDAACDSGLNHAIRLLLLPAYKIPEQDIDRALVKAIRSINVPAADTIFRTTRKDILGLAVDLLRAAEKKDSGPMVELLLRYGVSPDSCDERRQTPLHGAAWVGNDEAVSILHKAGADIDWADELGRTPLMKAAYCCRERAVETLLDCGAEVNAQDEVGLTALHLALRTGYIFQDFSCIRILLSKGASIRAVDCSGMSPWDVANELGEPEIIRLVESARDQRLVPQE